MEADGELSLTAAARVLDVSEAFVERLCDQGLLRCRFRKVLGENWLPEYVKKANSGGIERVLL